MLRGEAVLCGFTVHLRPLNPHGNVEVVKCHQLGHGEGGRMHKNPTKGGHCQERGSGGRWGSPLSAPRPQPPLPPSSGADGKAALSPWALGGR